jgi:hypothetical protein
VDATCYYVVHNIVDRLQMLPERRRLSKLPEWFHYLCDNLGGLVRSPFMECLPPHSPVFVLGKKAGSQKRSLSLKYLTKLKRNKYLRNETIIYKIKPFPLYISQMLKAIRCVFCHRCSRRMWNSNSIFWLLPLDVIDFDHCLISFIPLQQLFIARTHMRRIEIGLGNLLPINPTKCHQSWICSTHQTLPDDIHTMFIVSFVECRPGVFDVLVFKEIVQVVVPPDHVQTMHLMHTFYLRKIALFHGSSPVEIVDEKGQLTPPCSSGYWMESNDLPIFTMVSAVRFTVFTSQILSHAAVVSSLGGPGNVSYASSNISFGR